MSQVIYVGSLISFYYILQPDNPAEFGKSVYEMMALAIANQEESSGSVAATSKSTESKSTEPKPTESKSSESTSEGEVVEASEILQEEDLWQK